MKNIFLLIIPFFLFIGGCNSSGGSSKEISIHLLSDPDKLNPASSMDASSQAMERFLFQKLIDWDYDKGDFVGMIAEGKPVITEITSGKYAGGLKLDYTIRPEAKWDNGDPITVYDVMFTFKAILNPKTNCEQIRPYFDFIADIQFDSTNLKKFSVISNKKYILVEEYSGYWVLPESVYDPNHLMRNFSFEILNNPAKQEELRGNNEILKFSDEFNSQKYARENDFVVGSGPYKLTKWVTGSEIIFEKKENWWGNKSSSDLMKTYAQIPRLHFKVINDWNTAATAIKGGQLDVAHSIEYKAYNQLIQDEEFISKFNKFTPMSDQYLYLGLNNNNPILKDIAVRQALCYSIDKNEIINTLLYGLATPIESMVLPTKKYYDSTIPPYNFDINKAAKLLDDAGWKDTDGDGIRDKVVDGKKLKMSFNYKYNAGNDTRKNIGLIFKENLKRLGIELTITNKEWTVFLDDLKKHDFDIYAGAWVGDPNVEDPKQIWSTESTSGGSNYVSYGDIYSDRLIEQIRTELNESKRDALYKQLQIKIHNDAPYIFLYTPLERIAIAKRIQNAKAYTVKPGYDLGLMQLKNGK